LAVDTSWAFLVPVLKLLLKIKHIHSNNYRINEDFIHFLSFYMKHKHVSKNLRL
jgi:hypothetical protein